MSKKRNKIVFLAHWVENWNWLLWFVKDLHKNPQNHKYWILFAPIYYMMSSLYLFGRKAYDVVDQYNFNKKINGEIVLLRNFGWHFFVKKQRDKIRKRILRSVLDAQDRGADVIGLGALTKAEWLTQGGKWIVDQLSENLKVPIVHGDTLTAAIVVRQALRIKPDSVFITGATSKIGRAVVLSLASSGVRILMHTISKERFSHIKHEAGVDGKYIQRSDNLFDGAECDLWITGKAVPVGKKLLKFIPANASVLNFSVPNPLSERSMKLRRDIFFIEGGLIAYSSAKTDLSFTMRLKPGTTYACHAGVMVHAIKGWTHNEIGAVDMSLLNETFEAALDLGFFLPKLKNETEEFSIDSTRERVLSIEK